MKFEYDHLLKIKKTLHNADGIFVQVVTIHM